MRNYLLLCLFFCILNCENKKTNLNTPNKNTIKPTIEKENLEPIKQSKAEEDTTKFTKLNDKNAMYFFQDYNTKHKEHKVKITTDFGDIEIELYKETIYHRSNFIFLTKQHYFDGTQFYRVINNFVIQGGSGDDMETGRKRSKIGQYLLPPDTKRGFKHDRGVISMPSSEIDNPHKLASPYEFFIVQQKGGAHYLNGDYTVFGKVTKGMDVVDKIAAVPTDKSDWPVQSVFIRKVEILE